MTVCVFNDRHYTSLSRDYRVPGWGSGVWGTVKVKIEAASYQTPSRPAQPRPARYEWRLGRRFATITGKRRVYLGNSASTSYVTVQISCVYVDQA